MASKTIATLLFLTAFAPCSADSASAQAGGVMGGGSHGEGGGSIDGGSFRRGGFHAGDGRGFHRRTFGGYAIFDGNVYDNSGYGDWYGISPGYDECPLFRQRVKTPNGWDVRMIPIC
jgi:hypothetical protein